MNIKNLKILYEDNHLIAVFKPAGLLVQGDASGAISLMDIVKDYLKEKYNKPGDVFLGLVHRLDRPVAGIVLFAKTSKGASRVSEQFREHEVSKIYTAVFEGELLKDEGTLEVYIKKDEKLRKAYVFDRTAFIPDSSATGRNAVSGKGVGENSSFPSGGEQTKSLRTERVSKMKLPADNFIWMLQDAQKAVLSYKVLRREKGTTWAQIGLHTGRFHQIRATFAHIGHPVVGDVKYGAKIKYREGEIALCASELSFKTATEPKSVHLQLDPEKVFNF